MDRALLEAGLATIRRSDSGCAHCGQFPDLIADLAVDQSSHHRAWVEVTRINQGLWGVFTSAQRLEWQRTMVAEGHLPELAWVFFAGADVTLFHVTLRSLFDHAAGLIQLCADQPGTVPGDSFRALRTWLGKAGNERRLGTELSTVVANAGWFDAMRDVRDSIVHEGGQPIVLPPKEGVWFQVVGPRVKQVLEPALMPNPNVVDFELYAGMYTGYTLGFLDRVSAIARKRFGRPAQNGLAWASVGGISTIHGWMERLLLLMGRPQP